MAYEARTFLNYENSIKLPSSEDLTIDYSDVKLNLKLLNKYFEVNTLDEILVRRRNEFKTRTEHLQKRKEALNEREIMFKERIIRLKKGNVIFLLSILTIVLFYLVMKCILK
ncbi:unnamed protein product [Rotaria sp. Silwood2]|nr:unnamed protein product [Rotaria sp. Silwood2]